MVLLLVMNNLIAWAVVIIVWYLVVLPLSTSLFGKGDSVMFWVANIAGLLVLKAIFKEKIEELLRYS